MGKVLNSQRLMLISLPRVKWGRICLCLWYEQTQRWPGTSWFLSQSSSLWLSVWYSWSIFIREFMCQGGFRRWVTVQQIIGEGKGNLAETSCENKLELLTLWDCRCREFMLWNGKSVKDVFENLFWRHQSSDKISSGAILPPYKPTLYLLFFFF